MPSKIKSNNKNHSYSTIVPQKSQVGTTESQPKISLDGFFNVLDKVWDTFWADFPGNQEQLEEVQVKACLEIIEAHETKVVGCPSADTSAFNLEEIQYAWYCAKYAQLNGFAGGAE